MTGLSYMIVLSDGRRMRALHPEALGAQRTRIDLALSAVVADKVAQFPDFLDVGPTPPSKGEGMGVTPIPRPAAPPVDPNTSTQGEIARASGFTGDHCGDCGSFAMVRTGTCVTCQACGKPSGGCS